MPRGPVSSAEGRTRWITYETFASIRERPSNTSTVTAVSIKRLGCEVGGSLFQAFGSSHYLESLFCVPLWYNLRPTSVHPSTYGSPHFSKLLCLVVSSVEPSVSFFSFCARLSTFLMQLSPLSVRFPVTALPILAGPQAHRPAKTHDADIAMYKGTQWNSLDWMYALPST